MTEADLTQAEGVWREPQGDGWYVLNAHDATEGGGYPVDETALKHDAGVEVETNEPREAYAKFSEIEPSPYPGRLLPE
jgi:hypothetical protein